MSKVVKGPYLADSVAGFTPRTAMEEAARCLLCHDAPCSKGCPAGTDPAKFIRSIRFRNVKGAAETIRENNILGGTCAHVCPYNRLCEEACSRCGIDKPIQIGLLQRYAVEQEEALGMQILKAPAEKKAAKVACIGAGPASLACAAKLAQEGYPKSGFTYDTFKDNAGMMTTDSDKNAYKLYELIDFIDSTIYLFDGMKNATVTITLGEQIRYIT